MLDRYLSGSLVCLPSSAVFHGKRYFCFCTKELLVIETCEFVHVQTISIDFNVYSISICKDGRIAVGHANGTAIYCCASGNLWTLDKTIISDSIYCVDWNRAGELITAGKKLTYYSDDYSVIYSYTSMSPIKCVQFSPDSLLFSCIGNYDRLVKVFYAEENEYSFNYLLHPRTVSQISWRSPHPHKRMIDRNVLLSSCLDGLSRLWTCSLTQPNVFYQVACIDARQFTVNAFPLHWMDHEEVLASVDSGRTDTVWSIKLTNERTTLHKSTAERVRDEPIKEAPDLVFCLDEQGSFVIWAIEGLGVHGKTPKVHVVQSAKQCLSVSDAAFFQNAVIVYNSAVKVRQESVWFPSELSLLALNANGSLNCYTLDLDTLFTRPSLSLSNSWSGHKTKIKSVVSLHNLCASVSETECIVWRVGTKGVGKRNSDGFDDIVTITKAKAACFTKDVYLVVLSDNLITVNSVESSSLNLITSVSASEMENDVCSFGNFIITINKEFHFNAYELLENRLELRTSQLLDSDHTCYAFVPQHASTDSLFQLVIANMTQLNFYHYEPGLGFVKVGFWVGNVSSLSCSAFGKVAVYTNKQLLILGHTLAMEFRIEHKMEMNDVPSTSWLTTWGGQSLLAVSIHNSVVLFCQERNHALSVDTQWTQFAHLTAPIDMCPFISHITWLWEGRVLVVSGQRLLFFSKWLVSKESSAVTPGSVPPMTLNLAFHLNRPLPDYHPDLLSEYLLWGKSNYCQLILSQLYYFLQYNTVDGIPPVPIGSFLCSETNSVLTKEKIQGLRDVLTQSNLNGLTPPEQLYLLRVLECMDKLQQVASLDANGNRFLLAAAMKSCGKTTTLSYKDMTWALFSQSQPEIVKAISQKCVWEELKHYGVGMWLKSPEDLKRLVETMAKNQFIAERNPHDCMLFYIALGKKNIVLGLWKSSTHEERNKTVTFLQNNFDEERWKTAALKNAFALLSLQRFQLAASFFLLAKSLDDAINVCLQHMNDVHLAVLLARIWNGDGNAVVVKNLHAATSMWERIFFKSLIGDLDGVIAEMMKRTKDWDPSVLILFNHLNTLQHASKVSKVDEKSEERLVFDAIAAYDSFGCPLLALEIIKTASFSNGACVDYDCAQQLKTRLVMRQTFSIVSSIAAIFQYRALFQTNIYFVDYEKEVRRGLEKLSKITHIDRSTIDQILIQKCFDNDAFDVCLEFLVEKMFSSDVCEKQSLELLVDVCESAISLLFADNTIEHTNLEEYLYVVSRNLLTAIVKWPEFLAKMLTMQQKKYSLCYFAISAYYAFALSTLDHKNFNDLAYLVEQCPSLMNALLKEDVKGIYSIVKDLLDPLNRQSEKGRSPTVEIEVSGVQYYVDDDAAKTQTALDLLELFILRSWSKCLEGYIRAISDKATEDYTRYLTHALAAPLSSVLHKVERQVMSKVAPLYDSARFYCYLNSKQKRVWDLLAGFRDIAYLTMLDTDNKADITTSQDSLTRRENSDIVYKSHVMVSCFAVNPLDENYAAIATPKAVYEVDISISQRFLRLKSQRNRDRHGSEVGSRDSDTMSMVSDGTQASDAESISALSDQRYPITRQGLLRNVSYDESQNRMKRSMTLPRSESVQNLQGAGDNGKRLKRSVVATSMDSHPSFPYYLMSCEGGYGNNPIVLWQFARPKELFVYNGSGARVTRLHFDTFGQKFGVADVKGELNLFKFDSPPTNARPIQTIHSHTRCTNDFTFMNSSNFIATAGHSLNQMNVCLWDTLLPPSKNRVKLHEGGAHSIAYSPRHQLLFSGGKRGDISIYDIRHRRILTTLTPHTLKVKTLCVDDSTNLLISGSTDGDIQLFDLSNEFAQVDVWKQMHEKNHFIRATFDRNPVGTYGVMECKSMNGRVWSCGGDGTLRRSVLDE